MGVVLDASALLAFLHRESGGERVPPLLDGARVSTVNRTGDSDQSAARIDQR